MFTYRIKITSRLLAVYYLYGIVHASPPQSSPPPCIVVVHCHKVCAYHRVTGLKQEYFFTLILSKNKFPRIRKIIIYELLMQHYGC